MSAPRYDVVRALVGAVVLGVGCRASAPAPTGDVIAVHESRRARIVDRTELARFSLDVPLPADTGECVRQPAHGGVGTLFTVYRPDAGHAVSATSVVVDSAGHIVNFSEQRGRATIHGVRGGTRAQFDSALAEARRTTRASAIMLDFARGIAILGNDGGGLPDQSITVLLSDVANDPRFDRPLQRAYMIAARCDDRGDRAFFEFHIDKPAVYVGGTSVTPHPAATGGTVVQFVVDTTGAVRAGTFKVLMAGDSALIEDAKRVLTQWRYAPAEMNGRKIPQLVQTVIAR